MNGFGTQPFGTSAFGRGWRDLILRVGNGRTGNVRTGNGRSRTVTTTPRED